MSTKNQSNKPETVAKRTNVVMYCLVLELNEL